MVLPSPNSNDPTPHETKRYDKTNDDEERISTASQKHAIHLTFDSTILTVAVVSFSFSKKLTTCQTHSTPYPFSPIVTGKQFKSAVFTLLELEISEPNSPMHNTDQRKT